MGQFVEVKLGHLKSADWNYKEEDEVLLQLLINNIRSNGLIENIIIRQLAGGLYEVVNGNHRLTALQRLKFEKAMCYDLGKVDMATAKRIAVETNETAFEVDKDKFNSLLSDLADEFDKSDLEQTLLSAAMELSPDRSSEDRLNSIPDSPTENKAIELKKIEFVLNKKVIEEFTLLLCSLCQAEGINVDELNLDYSSAIELLIKKLSGQ